MAFENVHTAYRAPRKSRPGPVELARMIADDGWTAAELAAEYGVSRSAIVQDLNHAGFNSATGLPKGQDPNPVPLAVSLAAMGEWVEEALCAQADPEAFFPEKGGNPAQARALCRACPVAAECLDYALTNRERYGIWGGLSPHDRRRLLTHPT